VSIMATRTWPETANGNTVARSLLHPRANGQFDLVDHDNGLPVSFADSPSTDAFSRLRVDIPKIVWEGKAIYGKDSHSYQEAITGAGSSAVWRTNEASVRLTCDTGVADKAVRQTKKYFPYIPGHSQVSFFTFNLIAQPEVNRVKRVGRFDANDGMFLEWNATDIRFVVRTSTSGSPVDTSYASQADWNLDTLDGTNSKDNPSGEQLDLTKTHILVIDYQWLGVGRVRFGFDIGGVITYCHEFNHANTETIVYMQTPNLPVRYEISNSGATSLSDYMDMICSSVVSEGGDQPLGHDYALDIGNAGVAVGQTRVPVLAMRQSLTFNGKVNRRIALLNTIGILSLGDNIIYEVTQYPIPDITITGGWVDLDTDHSTMQYAVGSNIVVNSETGAHPFYKDFAASSSLGSKVTPGAANAAIGVRTHHNEMLVNYDGTACEVIVVWVTALSATGSTVHVTANCLEYA
jgi:hypothetical protein